MINNLQLSGIHADLTDEVEAYARKKIGGLDKFIPTRARSSLQADVKLIQQSSKKKLDCACEVVVSLPQETIRVSETGSTMLAAIDGAENKLKIRLKKYKESHGKERIHRQVIRKILRRRDS